MLFARIGGMSAVALSLSLCPVGAQTRPSPERVAALQQMMSSTKQQAINKLSDRLKKALSGGALNLLQFETFWQSIQQTFGEGTSDAQLASIQAALEKSSRLAPSIASSGPIPVSDPSLDFVFSLSAGFTQSETSTAWCGSGVVAGFNDSGSEFESLLFGAGGISFGGAGASTDGGFSFRDIGYINPGPNVSNFLAGDPVVNCTNATTFYYSQIGSSGTVSAPTSVVFMSKSTDGGFTWDDPVSAISKDGSTHSLDKDWSAIEPNHPNDIYVSYTDFDLSFTSCPTSERVAVEIVHSTDGGVTWSAPTVLDEVCSTIGQFVQGSQIVVDSHANVYVEWEFFPTGMAGPTRVLRIARSTNHAVSFAPFSVIDTVTPTGDGFAIQGYFRTWLTGNLAVDRSGTPATDGSLYVTWEDGRFRSRFDLESPTGLYHNANVLISRSSDQGRTWSAPVRVNTDAFESSVGFGIDHFQPGVAVDATGALAVCWYDRRDDRLNYQVSRYCGTSTNLGTTWTNLRVDPRIWPPIHATDAFINAYYLGDYDTVASDKLKTLPGFQGAYGNVTFFAPVPNQDVFLVHVAK